MTNWESLGDWRWYINIEIATPLQAVWLLPISVFISVFMCYSF